jgi:hypothetical protein
MEKKKTVEKVAEFTKGNCTFIVRQPVEDPTPEELENFYLAMGKLMDRQ